MALPLSQPLEALQGWPGALEHRAHEDSSWGTELPPSLAPTRLAVGFGPKELSPTLLWSDSPRGPLRRSVWVPRPPAPPGGSASKAFCCHSAVYASDERLSTLSLIFSPDVGGGCYRQFMTSKAACVWGEDVIPYLPRYKQGILVANSVPTPLTGRFEGTQQSCVVRSKSTVARSHSRFRISIRHHNT